MDGRGGPWLVVRMGDSSFRWFTCMSGKSMKAQLPGDGDVMASLALFFDLAAAFAVPRLVIASGL